METLKFLVRNLAFILLLASFLEMLLPNKSMRGFIQLVMGLFVISAILNPVADFLKLKFTDEIPAWATFSSKDLPVLASEGRSQELGKSIVREQYKKILINQIKALVLSVDGVKSSEVEVELDDEVTGSFAEYPQVLKVQVFFSRKSNAVKPIKPVIIGEKEDPQKEESSKEREVREKVAKLMQMPEERVFVSEKM